MKTGDTYPEIITLWKDFEYWFQDGLGLDEERSCIIDVHRDEPLPDPSEFAGIVITGSPLYVTDDLPWIQRAADWLLKAIDHNIPTLGVCYGHQLLGYALKGKVGYNPNGIECGIVSLSFTEAAANDPLLHSLPSPVVYVAHAQSVLSLPEGAELLASSPIEPNQAFSYKGIAWGLQFHPEFNGSITKMYIERKRDDLSKVNRDADHLIAECNENDNGRIILRRFLDFVDQKQSTAS